MRELSGVEIGLVSGGVGECTPETSGNNFYGVSNTGGFGNDLINIYEGLVAATSHVIERVATAF